MPRATDYDGNTLLHAACSRGALRAAKLVVRWAVYSAHPPDRNFLNLQSAAGYTALARTNSPPSLSSIHPFIRPFIRPVIRPVIRPFNPTTHRGFHAADASTPHRSIFSQASHITPTPHQTSTTPPCV